MAYPIQIQDEFGRLYDRKNRYLIDLIEAQGTEEANQIRRNRSAHPYIQALSQYEKEEAELLTRLKKEAEGLAPVSERKEVNRLNQRYYVAQRSHAFYEAHRDLTYDAVLKADTTAHEMRHIPDIIDLDRSLKERLLARQAELAHLDEGKRASALQEKETRQVKRQKALEAELAHSKEIFQQGLVSKKAYQRQVKMKKKRAADDLQALSYLDQKVSLEEEIKNIKHRQKVDLATAIKLLESDIADVRRRTPVELEKKRPFKAFLTFLLPGLGQLWNGQKEKAFFLFLGTLFLYLVALPYALGFGNYQGQGIFGLIHLANGGAKLDKSIIFMIEGIIAILFCLLSLFLLILSFQDVWTVERKEIEGVRPKNWFETKNTLKTDGFPYLVSTPALVVILFIVLMPIITTFLISFTNMDPSHQNKFQWYGLNNYLALIKGEGMAGSAFWTILGWTLIWTLAASTLSILIGFLLALLLNQERIRGKGFFRTIYLLPWAVPAFITIMFFSIMLGRGGPFTEALNGLFHTDLDVKNSATLTRMALILIQGWLGSSYIFLLTTGVLQGISKDLYEAAEIDGATALQRLSKITVPLVLFQTGPLLISQYTMNFNNFSIIYLFNGGGPFNPTVYGNLAGSSDLLISYIYKLTIQNQYQGMGAAITILISLVLILVTFIGYSRTAAFKEY